MIFLLDRFKAQVFSMPEFYRSNKFWYKVAEVTLQVLVHAFLINLLESFVLAGPMYRASWLDACSDINQQELTFLQQNPVSE